MSAFRAAFADFKLVKTRSVGQFIFEVPVEDVDKALKVLGGVPKPATEAWAAIALLKPEPVKGEPSERAKRKWHELSLPEQIGIRCNDPRFHQFLGGHMEPDTAADIVRSRCGVASRRDIQPGTEAANRWQVLETDYLKATGQIAEEHA